MSQPVKAHIIVCSTRAAAGIYEDLTGPMLVAWAHELGYECAAAEVVADGEPVRVALEGALAAGCDIVVTTGGTGVSATDVTPEATASVLTVKIPGIIEAIRARGAAKVPTAWLSRGEAGLAETPHGRALVVNLPGSRGGVKDGIAVLHEVAPHVLAQLRGVDHGSH